jgi:Bacterial Ig-like domain (group 1)/PKD domain
MNRVVLLVAVLAAACAYHTPTQPSAPPPSRTDPSRIVIDFVSGTGTAHITARVLNSVGDALIGQRVTFSTDAGTIAPTQAMTDTDGHALTVLTSSASAHVTATAGTLRAESPIAIQAAIQPLPPAPPPVLTPTPPPPVPPAPTPPPTPSIALTLECTPAAPPALTGCHVTLTAPDGTPLTTTISRVDWDWGDGNVDVLTVNPIVTQHAYVVSGTYTVFVKVYESALPSGSMTASTAIKIP